MSCLKHQWSVNKKKGDFNRQKSVLKVKRESLLFKKVIAFSRKLPFSPKLFYSGGMTDDLLPCHFEYAA